MLEFWEFMYMCIFVLVILVLKEIIEYVLITRKGGNVINIEDTQSNTKTNEIGTNTRFKKKKGGKDDKIIEGFFSCPGPAPTDDAPTCDKAEWLFCDVNFNNLKILMSKFHSTYKILDQKSMPSALPAIITEITIEQDRSQSPLLRESNLYFRDDSNIPFKVWLIRSANNNLIEIIDYNLSNGSVVGNISPTITLNSNYNFFFRAEPHHYP